MIRDYEQLRLGQELRDDALARVETNANQAWKEIAYERVRLLASFGQPFTSDDVWATMDDHEVRTHEPRAMGAVMRRAQREGIILRTDRFVVSHRAVCHCQPKRVWMPA